MLGNINALISLMLILSCFTLLKGDATGNVPPASATIINPVILSATTILTENHFPFAFLALLMSIADQIHPPIIISILLRRILSYYKLL
ncbi:MAG: hypothetical protein LBV33_05035 [Lachnospiraceae bacterium]|jgi:hypothetical protein|nr:hypothetical protein [Lachnospiraceae bacterium]